MKSLLAMLFTVVLFIIVVGGGSFIWYLSHTAEFSQKTTPNAADTTLPPAIR
jgi:hypothetical protein